MPPPRLPEVAAVLSQKGLGQMRNAGDRNRRKHVIRKAIREGWVEGRASTRSIIGYSLGISGSGHRLTTQVRQKVLAGQISMQLEAQQQGKQ